MPMQAQARTHTSTHRRALTHARPYKDTIAAFDRTPPGIACPHFIELRWAFGCPYSCQWCYLMGTSFGRKHFRAYDLKNTLRHLRRFFLEILSHAIRNTK